MGRKAKGGKMRERFRVSYEGTGWGVEYKKASGYWGKALEYKDGSGVEVCQTKSEAEDIADFLRNGIVPQSVWMKLGRETSAETAGANPTP